MWFTAVNQQGSSKRALKIENKILSKLLKMNHCKINSILYRKPPNHLIHPWSLQITSDITVRSHNHPYPLLSDQLTRSRTPFPDRQSALFPFQSSYRPLFIASPYDTHTLPSPDLVMVVSSSSALPFSWILITQQGFSTIEYCGALPIVVPWAEPSELPFMFLSLLNARPARSRYYQSSPAGGVSAPPPPMARLM